MRGPILRYAILVSVVSVGLLCSIPALSRDITVAAGRSIQDAIDRADEGDTVSVSAGTYNESVQLRCGIRLQGQGPDLTFIRSSGRYPAIYAQGADGPTVSGFTVECPTSSTQAAVYLEASVATISNCRITGGAHGCAVVDGSDVVIEDCTIENCAGNGVGVWDSRVTVERCVIRDNGYNAVGVSGGSAEVRDCELLDNTRTGIQFDGANGTAENNVIAGNQSAGVAITGDARPTIRNNTIRYNKFGCIAKDRVGGVIERCVIYANTASGVLARGEGTTTRIDSNTIVDNEENGVFVLDGAESEITRNIIVGNGSTGIDLRNEGSEDGTPAKVSDNCVWGNAEADYDGMAPSTSDRSEDPLFADPEAGDFRVRAMSPCRDFDPFGRPIGALPEWVPLAEDPVIDWTKLVFERRMVQDYGAGPQWMIFEIALGSEAEGFACKVIAAETESAKPSAVGAVYDLYLATLDDHGEAEVTFEWPFTSSEGWVQLLIAARLQDFEAPGGFVEAEPVKIERPEPETEEQDEAVPGDDMLRGQAGDDPLFGCVEASPFILDECLMIQFGPSSLRCGPVCGIAPELQSDGSVIVRAHEGGAPAGRTVYYTAVGLPAMPCCSELHLRKLRLCYQCLSSSDSIERIEIGYLSDEGEYVDLAESVVRLTSTAWDCVTITLNDAVVPRPFLIGFRLLLGGGAAGGVRFGNLAAVLAPGVGAAGGAALGQTTPPSVKCASLCVGTLENVRGTAQEFIWCASGFDLSPPSSEYEESPPGFLAIGLVNTCDEPIYCQRWEILDGSKNVIASRRVGSSIDPEIRTPQEIGRWDVTKVPEGVYRVVAVTDVGNLETRVRITRRTPD